MFCKRCKADLDAPKKLRGKCKVQSDFNSATFAEDHQDGSGSDLELVGHPLTFAPIDEGNAPVPCVGSATAVLTLNPPDTPVARGELGTRLDPLFDDPEASPISEC